MISFFEKLKKGMGIEIPEEKEEEIKEVKKVKEKPKRNLKPKEIELGQPEIKKVEIKEGEIEITPAKEKGAVSEEKKVVEGKEKWFETEGQLAIDVYQTENELVIQSAIAGVKPEDLDISMERDILTIKGSREKPFEESGDYFTQECYWGPFSREVILPVEVDPDRAEATMKDGILTIRIPKILREKKRKIRVRI